ncbi:MAG: DUF4286 family protein [Paludibacteraceae bacterium]|nr:DUF4286 family protein [Paludibacteraceae bacterium]
MIICNTTYCMEAERTEEFLEWLRNEHLPSMEATGVLTSPVVSRVMTTGGDEAVSISVQLRAESQETYEAWRAKEGGSAVQSLRKRFGETVLSFTTLMEVLI